MAGIPATQVPREISCPEGLLLARFVYYVDTVWFLYFVNIDNR